MKPGFRSFLSVLLVAAGSISTPGILLGADAQAAATPANSGPADSAAVQGRKHPSYQVFTVQTRLPEIRAGGRGEVVVLASEVVTITAGVSLPLDDASQLSEVLRVPAAVLDRICARLPAQAAAAELAVQFRTEILDYLYLLERWTMYRPKAGDEKLKVEGLEVLAAGDLAAAWSKYAALRKPSPPGAAPGVTFD